jgi:hypothetical protein
VQEVTAHRSVGLRLKSISRELMDVRESVG